jgi:hypothetical protein
VIDRCQLIVVVALVLASSGRAEDVKLSTQANVTLEIPFQARADHQDPFNTIQLGAVFTAPDGSKRRVPAFWAGGKKWKVRYASPHVGIHKFRSECSDDRDAGLNDVSGSVQIGSYTGDNPLYKHGPVRVAPNRRYLQHADGTPFFWLGDTWWMGLCHRIHWPDEVKTLAADRKEKGFNVIQLVAGLYPDMPPFDPRGANEAGFPWEEKYARIRPEYFDAADRRIQYLVEQGFTPCIVGAWGYYMPWMGVDKIKQQWRYLIARYGAMPVVWCAAGEANLPWYLVKGFPYDDRKQVTQWTEVLRYIREADPYHRPLTIHPTGIGRLSARNATDDAALLDFDMLQTPHAGREAVGPTVATMQQSYADKPKMPVIDGEAAYEMLNDKLPTQWSRQMFWLCMTNGAAGHTYGANGIWQCNRRGEPHGPSPHGGNYGNIPWDEAMNLPGSRQVGLGKKLFERYQWQDFAPHPEWVTYANVDESQKPKWGHWIWFPEGDPKINAPVEKRYFRKTFELPMSDPLRGMLSISADDRFTAYVNGKKVRAHTGTGTFLTIDVSPELRPGRNVLAIEAENLPFPVSANPSGLIASLRLQNAKEKERILGTDESWRCAKKVTNNGAWMSDDFDDSTWSAAKVLGPYGCKPWGKFQSAQHYGPFATGTPDKTRIIYAPEPLTITVLDLKPVARYMVAIFDPASGELIPGNFESSEDGTWSLNKPSRIDSDDWVIVIERME